MEMVLYFTGYVDKISRFFQHLVISGASLSDSLI